MWTAYCLARNFMHPKGSQGRIERMIQHTDWAKMNLKHTALLTLLLLLLQQTGFVFAAISITQPDSSVQSHQHQSNSHHEQTGNLTDSIATHHDDGQHCDDCQCCGVLGCYLAVNVSDLRLFSFAPSSAFSDFNSIYSDTHPAGLYRPPSFL